MSSSPSGPATPAGGWKVEYADAFGTCFTDPATKCSAGYPRTDNTLVSMTHAHGDGNSNEIASFVPGENDVTSSGLAMHCDAIATSTDHYSCGAMVGKASGSFNWTPSDHYVMQFVGKLPVNEGNMDPAVWSTGQSYAWENDFPEFWGYNHYPSQSNTWCGFQFTMPGVPVDSGGGTGQTPLTFCSSPGTNFDPSAGFHTYTLDMNGANMTAYIDGVQVSNHNFGSFSNALGKLWLQNDMRADKQTGATVDSHFPASGNVFYLRSIAFYEPASANNAGTNGPMYVPGTNVQ